MVFYNTDVSSSVRIQSNPSYGINVNQCNESSCHHYEYVDNPSAVDNNSPPGDDIYDNAIGVDEYLEVA